MTEVLILKKRKDFVRVAKQGEKMVSSTVILQAAQTLSEETAPARLGYTSTTKIGKAHVRNKTRRRLRAAAREIFPFHALPNTDYVLIGRYNTADCRFEKLKKDMVWSLNKINKLLTEPASNNEEHNQTNSDSAD